MEFKAAGWINEHDVFKDGMQEALCMHVMKLLRVFSEEGHSGTTAPYTVDLFKKLAMFEPIVPLTGEDWEWHEPSPGVFQNKRCGHVFKQQDRFDGQPYDIQGKVFYRWCERPLDPDEKGYPGMRRFKDSFTNSNSHVPIMFPYTPKIEYVEISNGD